MIWVLIVTGLALAMGVLFAWSLCRVAAEADQHARVLAAARLDEDHWLGFEDEDLLG